MRCPGSHAQRGLQRHPGQRPVAARIGRERQQHKRFDPPRLGQRSRQQRPQRLRPRPALASDGQRVQRVAYPRVGQAAAQPRQIVVGTGSPLHAPAAAAMACSTSGARPPVRVALTGVVRAAAVIAPRSASGACGIAARDHVLRVRHVARRAAARPAPPPRPSARPPDPRSVPASRPTVQRSATARPPPPGRRRRRRAVRCPVPASASVNASASTGARRGTARHDIAAVVDDHGDRGVGPAGRRHLGEMAHGIDELARRGRRA